MLKNRFLDAVLKLMLLSAFLHMIVLSIYTVLTGDTTHSSFLKIIAIDLFYPELVNSPVGQYLSFASVIVLYILLYIFFTNKKRIIK